MRLPQSDLGDIGYLNKIAALKDKYSNLRQGIAAGYKGKGFSRGECESTRKAKEDPAEDNVVGFQEVFGGEGSLTDAIRRRGLVAFDSLDLDTGNLLEYEVYKALLKRVRLGHFRWLHGAPPCRTFSRARKRDRFWSVRLLRSEEAPGGIEPVGRGVREANLLAQRMARLCRAQDRAGGWWSIENPESSFLWIFSPVASLAKLPGRRRMMATSACLAGFTGNPHGGCRTQSG